MRSKYFTLLTMALLLVGAKVLAQCPGLEKFNQGQGGANTCGGVNGTPIPANFTGTTYATVPSGTKTAELNASWTANPAPLVPAVGGVYFNAMKTDHEAGPPTVPAQQGPSKWVAQYCFYHPLNANIPSFKTITIVYIDPQADTVLSVCSFDPGGDPLIPPTITLEPTDAIGCLGYKSRFVVGAVKGEPTDTAVRYRWLKNGDSIGHDSILEIVVTPADTGTDIYQVEVIGMPSLALAISDEVSLFLNKPHTWTGAISTNWNTAGNWIPMTIPDSTNHVYVGPKTNKPFIPLLDTGRCKCLTLDTGWVDLNGRLEVAGRIQLLDSTRYISALTTGHLVMNGTELAQDIPDGTFLQNRVFGLTVANALGVNNIDTLDIYGFIHRVLGVLTTADDITLKSLFIGTARVRQGPAAGGYISGQVTVERHVPVVPVPPTGWRSWRLLAPITEGPQTIKEAWQENAAPLTNPNPGYGTMITCNSNFDETAGFDKVMPNMGIQAWDLVNQSLTTSPVTNTNVKRLDSEPAYFLFVRGDRTVIPAPIYNMATSTTLRSKGTLKQGDQLPIAVLLGQFRAVGNPFAAHLNFQNIAGADKLNLGNRFWLWDPRLSGSFQVGAWVLFDGSVNFEPNNPGGSYPALTSHPFIPMGMGFFVQATGGAGLLTIREAIKADNTDNQGFKTAITNERLHVQLSYIKSKSPLVIEPADGVFAIFHETYSGDVDAADAGKPENMGENLAILRDNNKLSLEARSLVKGNDTIPLKIWNLRKLSDYRFAIRSEINTPGVKAAIVDRYLQTTQPLDLNGTTNVDFKLNIDNASAAADRFYIAMSYDPVVSVGDPTAEDNITVYPNPTDAQNININIKTADNGEYTFKVIDAQGKLVHAETYENSDRSLSRSLAVQGRLVPGNYFIVVSKDGHELSTKKLIINK